MNKRFNVRVYGICIADNKLLVSEELFNGKLVTKFPGGGLEYGEGTIDCLKREWKEELDLDIEVTEHFYTTDHFIRSWIDDSQVFCIYYLVAIPANCAINNTVPGERTYWLNITQMSADTFTLPLDKIVANMIKEKYA